MKEINIYNIYFASFYYFEFFILQNESILAFNDWNNI